MLCTARSALGEYTTCLHGMNDRPLGRLTPLPHLQDASIKAFRPESEATGVAAMNGHAPGALRLAQEALPDVCSAKEDAHCGAVQTLALCGSYLCSAGGDAMIRIWDASTLAFFRCACLGVSRPFSLSCCIQKLLLFSCHWRWTSTFMREQRLCEAPLFHD